MARKRTPFMTGYCSFGHGSFPCPGQVVNNSRPGNVSLCSCACHGPLEPRLRAVGQLEAVPEPIEDDEDE